MTNIVNKPRVSRFIAYAYVGLVVFIVACIALFTFVGFFTPMGVYYVCVFSCVLGNWFTLLVQYVQYWDSDGPDGDSRPPREMRRKTFKIRLSTIPVHEELLTTVLEWFAHTDPKTGQEASMNACGLPIRVNDVESEVWRRSRMDGSGGDDCSDQDEQIGQRSWSVSAVSVLQPRWDPGWNAPCVIS